MSIEEMLYSAEEHGKRSDMFEEVARLKQSLSHLPLKEIYDEAYQIVMKT